MYRSDNFNIMNIRFKYSIVVIAILIMCGVLSTLPLLGQSKLKITCLGNAFTTGEGMIDSLQNRYPAQLQAMLGLDYAISVRSYAHKGLINALEDIAHQQMDVLFLELNPSIASSMSEEIGKKLINLEKKNIRVVLIPSFTRESQDIAALYPLAQRTNFEIIDLRGILLGRSEHFINDRYLSSIGATIVTRRLYEVLVMPMNRPVNLFKGLGVEAAEESFYGYESASLKVRGREAKVVRPKQVAKGLPWLWRARFWGHEPQVDIALLERGYHLVYCDVSELFGNEEAIAIWNDFYKLLTKAGLNKKSLMEGMSRGGIYCYNWLLAYPDRVTAVYTDAPVLALKSWPGGLGTGPGSKGDWELFKTAYRLSESEARSFNRSPLDRAEEVAALKIPLLHVVGDADEVVPIDENTMPFAQRIWNARGSLEVIHKPGVGHHPHSLEDPTAIVDFLLRADGRKLNFAAVAAPGSEFRSGAGWHPNHGWWGEHRDIERILVERKGALDILFVGNSITQGIGGTRRSVSGKPGLQSFSKVFEGLRWDCAGISGDRVQNVLWRLQNGKYKEAAPKIMVVTIGVNNFLNGDDAKEIADGILTIKDWVSRHMQQTKLLLTGPLPVGLSKEDPRRKKYEGVHAILKQKAKGKNVIYCPMDSCFIDKDGAISTEDYSTDGIHITGKGYEKWAEELGRIIKSDVRDNRCVIRSCEVFDLINYRNVQYHLLSTRSVSSLCTCVVH